MALQGDQEISLRGIDYTYYLFIHHYETFRKASIVPEQSQEAYLEAYQKAIDSRTGQQDKKESDATAYYLLGSLYQEMGNQAAANEAFTKELQLRSPQNTPVACDSKTGPTQEAAIQQVMAASCDTEAEACRKRGDYPKAQEHYEQALKSRQAIYGGKPHVYLAKTHSNLGQIQLQLKNYEAAAEHFGAAHKMYSECLGEDHDTTQQTAKALENVYLLFSERDSENAA